MEEEDYVIFTKSLADVEDFKYNLKRKKELLEKIKLPYVLPVIIYVNNPNIPDIKKTIYIVHFYTSLADLLEKVKTYMLEDRDDLKLCFKPEGEEDEGGLLEDLLVLEAWEDYKNTDSFLYLILDEDK